MTLDTKLIKNKILPVKYIRPGVKLANEINNKKQEL